MPAGPSARRPCATPAASIAVLWHVGLLEDLAARLRAVPHPCRSPAVGSAVAGPPPGRSIRVLRAFLARAIASSPPSDAARRRLGVEIAPRGRRGPAGRPPPRPGDRPHSASAAVGARRKAGLRACSGPAPTAPRASTDHAARSLRSSRLGRAPRRAPRLRRTASAGSGRCRGRARGQSRGLSLAAAAGCSRGLRRRVGHHRQLERPRAPRPCFRVPAGQRLSADRLEIVCRRQRIVGRVGGAGRARLPDRQGRRARRQPRLHGRQRGRRGEPPATSWSSSTTTCASSPMPSRGSSTALDRRHGLRRGTRPELGRARGSTSCAERSASKARGFQDFYGEPADPRRQRSADTFFANGGAFAVTREAYHRAGGFDDRVLRLLRRRGSRLAAAADRPSMRVEDRAVAYHRHGATGRAAAGRPEALPHGTQRAAGRCSRTTARRRCDVRSAPTLLLTVRRLLDDSRLARDRAAALAGLAPFSPRTARPVRPAGARGAGRQRRRRAVLIRGFAAESFAALGAAVETCLGSRRRRQRVQARAARRATRDVLRHFGRTFESLSAVSSYRPIQEALVGALELPRVFNARTRAADRQPRSHRGQHVGAGRPLPRARSGAVDGGPRHRWPSRRAVRARRCAARSPASIRPRPPASSASPRTPTCCSSRASRWRSIRSLPRCSCRSSSTSIARSPSSTWSRRAAGRRRRAAERGGHPRRPERPARRRRLLHLRQRGAARLLAGQSAQPRAHQPAHLRRRPDAARAHRRRALRPAATSDVSTRRRAPGGWPPAA